jgi:Response regulators consisting of a CheY-like receiver domain and a winged-helix DNA-binding domain
MTAAACHCPTCGALYTGERPRVDLDRNLFLCANGVTHLPPRQAEIVSILARAYPRAVSVDLLISGVYGLAEPSDDPGNAIKVHISYARRLLRPLGWEVRRVYRGGYFLERWDA